MFFCVPNSPRVVDMDSLCMALKRPLEGSWALISGVAEGYDHSNPTCSPTYKYP